MNKLNLLGRKFGRLVVMKQNGHLSNGKAMLVGWLCRCDCGNYVTIRGSSLKSGKAKSCGCIRNEKTVARNTSHGKYHHPLYRIWFGIKRRCGQTPYSSDKEKRFYITRGIVLCKEWMDFENFYQWAINKWRPGLDIDRKNTLGAYSPKNCRFVTRKINAQNKRNCKAWVVFGKQFRSAYDAARFFGCVQSHIHFLCHGRITPTKTYYPEPFCYAVKKYGTDRV